MFNIFTIALPCPLGNLNEVVIYSTNLNLKWLIAPRTIARHSMYLSPL